MHRTNKDTASLLSTVCWTPLVGLTRLKGTARYGKLPTPRTSCLREEPNFDLGNRHSVVIGGPSAVALLIAQLRVGVCQFVGRIADFPQSSSVSVNSGSVIMAKRLTKGVPMRRLFIASEKIFWQPQCSQSLPSCFPAHSGLISRII